MSNVLDEEIEKKQKLNKDLKDLFDKSKKFYDSNNNENSTKQLYLVTHIKDNKIINQLPTGKEHLQEPIQLELSKSKSKSFFKIIRRKTISRARYFIDKFITRHDRKMNRAEMVGNENEQDKELDININQDIEDNNEHEMENTLENQNIRETKIQEIIRIREEKETKEREEVEEKEKQEQEELEKEKNEKENDKELDIEVNEIIEKEEIEEKEREVKEQQEREEEEKRAEEEKEREDEKEKDKELDIDKNEEKEQEAKDKENEERDQEEQDIMEMEEDRQRVRYLEEEKNEDKEKDEDIQKDENDRENEGEDKENNENSEMIDISNDPEMIAINEATEIVGRINEKPPPVSWVFRGEIECSDGYTETYKAHGIAENKAEAIAKIEEARSTFNDYCDSLGLKGNIITESFGEISKIEQLLEQRDIVMEKNNMNNEMEGDNSSDSLGEGFGMSIGGDAGDGGGGG